MLLLFLALLAPPPSERLLLEIEHNRAENVGGLLAALKSPEPWLQARAARTAGRLERPSLRDAVVPLLRSPDSRVRLEAVAALAQMGASFAFAALLEGEKDGLVRAEVYQAIGRARPSLTGAEAAVVAGLKDQDPVARAGAARGLESLIRQNLKTFRPSTAAVEALRAAIRENHDPRLRQFALLALNAAGDQDPSTIDLALSDPDPQVRRLAVVGTKRWVKDESPMVRLEAIRLAATCEQALAAIADSSDHVVLAAVDRLGKEQCQAGAIANLVQHGKDWRVRSHALVSLSMVAPDLARAKLAAFAADPRGQVRMFAANAAVLLKDQATLAALARDSDPNVAATALTTVDDALAVLGRDHAGLLLAAAARLKEVGSLRTAAPGVLAAILRLTRSGHATTRDQRVALIEVLGEAGDLGSLERLRPLLADRDPEVAALVAKLLSEKTGSAVSPMTTRYVPEPLPSEEELRSLEGARAIMVMRGLGSITLDLLLDEAPVTVATFADLAEKGAYDGLTFHRVVPNFVLQGGSPGADEYDALTPQFMRDELGFTSNERGTFGVSTRGHDTGDGQIFINLIDNWRLDHIYTVFARISAGLDVMDRIQEGDVIESVRILRR